MQQVTIEELVNYKILPFDLFTQGDELIFSAGEVITPGKFLQLRHVDGLFRREDNAHKVAQDVLYEEEQEFFVEQLVATTPKSFADIDQIDISKTKTPINKRAKIPAADQMRIKAYYDKILEKSYMSKPIGVSDMYHAIKNKIARDLSNISENMLYPSQLLLLGDYEKCHALNVAILSAHLAYKLGKSEEFIADVILAALLHDVGKKQLPPEILLKQNLSARELAIYSKHAELGYKIIKNQLGFKERIARVALEHHEKNDGTGYPKKISCNKISAASQIVSVCNYFDNLMFNKTNYKVKNGREALKIMLGLGSSCFSTDMLYTFVYMFNYDDNIAFEEMAL